MAEIVSAFDKRVKKLWERQSKTQREREGREAVRLTDAEVWMNIWVDETELELELAVRSVFEYIRESL